MIAQPLVDSHGRVMRDLRVSVTDRCNFRCLYCLPETEAAANFYRAGFTPNKGSQSDKPIVLDWKPRSQILTLEEIARLARLFVGLGIKKLRLTGGEPLLRRGIDSLITNLAQIDGIQDLALTTNGSSFAARAQELFDAGLHRITFSLDSLDRQNFQKLSGRDGLDEALKGIETAKRLGMTPVKVNAVIIRDLNDHEIGDLGQFARDHGVSMRFIEFMPLDSKHAWQREHVVSGKEILERLQERFDLQPLASSNRAETAKRWRFASGDGEIGVIAPVTEPFCGHCNRLRLTSDGQLRTCLFSLGEYDLKPALRGGASDAEIEQQIRAVVRGKEARHHIGEEDFQQPGRSMSCIGG